MLKHVIDMLKDYTTIKSKYCSTEKFHSLDLVVSTI